MNGVLRIVAAIVEYFVAAWKRREEYERSRLGEVEQFQQAVSGDDEQSEQEMQSTFRRWRLRRRLDRDKRV